MRCEATGTGFFLVRGVFLRGITAWALGDRIDGFVGRGPRTFKRDAISSSCVSFLGTTLSPSLGATLPPPEYRRGLRFFGIDGALNLCHPALIVLSKRVWGNSVVPVPLPMPSPV